jgi:pimeloyl-ACP methyl ester carboxylesterase
MGRMLRLLPVCSLPGTILVHYRSLVLHAHAYFTQVPLDYTKLNGSTAAVALLRVPSALSPWDKNYRGPIFINPGGPGGSGVDTVKELGTIFQQLMGTEYDIVGFDPRGVGRTTPSLSGFTSSELSTFAIQVQQDPLLGSTPDAVARTYARFAAFGQVAEKRLNDMAHFVSTPLVARDLLAITKAHGFDNLTYYGVSQGTVIGKRLSSITPLRSNVLLLRIYICHNVPEQRRPYDL